MQGWWGIPRVGTKRKTEGRGGWSVSASKGIGARSFAERRVVGGRSRDSSADGTRAKPSAPLAPRRTPAPRRTQCNTARRGSGTGWPAGSVGRPASGGTPRAVRCGPLWSAAAPARCGGQTQPVSAASRARLGSGSGRARQRRGRPNGIATKHAVRGRLSSTRRPPRWRCRAACRGWADLGSRAHPRVGIAALGAKLRQPKSCRRAIPIFRCTEEPIPGHVVDIRRCRLRRGALAASEGAPDARRGGRRAPPPRRRGSGGWPPSRHGRTYGSPSWSARAWRTGGRWWPSPGWWCESACAGPNVVPAPLAPVGS